MDNLSRIKQTLMKKFKKFWILLLWALVIMNVNFNYAQLSNWQPKTNFNENTDSTPIIDNEEIQNIEWWSQHISEKTLWIIHLPQPENYTTSLGYVMALIQIAINWTLWILAFIALIYLLYCGFLIFSAGADDKSASKWKGWIKTAAIALSGIGLSWLIISAMLRFINNIAASGN